MKAIQLITHGTPGKFELRDLPEPQPGPDEVVVQVQSCGLNHLDLWLEEGALPIPEPLPRTPGGEVAGFVFPGDRVDVILSHAVNRKDDPEQFLSFWGQRYDAIPELIPVEELA